MNRQSNIKGCAFPKLAADTNFTSKARNDSLDNRKSQACSSIIGAGSEKGVKDFVEIFRGYAGAVVGKSQLDTFIFYTAAYSEPMALFAISSLYRVLS